MILKGNLLGILPSNKDNIDFNVSDIGIVHYVEGETIYYTTNENDDIVLKENCKTAIPYFSTYKHTPLVKEKVKIINILESKESYYLPPVNISYKKYNNVDKNNIIFGGKYENYLEFGKDYINFYNNKDVYFLLNKDSTLINSPFFKFNTHDININTSLFSVNSDSIFIKNNKNIVIDSKNIMIGEAKEPLLFGGKTVVLLSNIFEAFQKFLKKLSVAKSTPEGVLLGDINVASNILLNTINQEIKQLKKLTSNNIWI